MWTLTSRQVGGEDQDGREGPHRQWNWSPSAQAGCQKGQVSHSEIAISRELQKNRNSQCGNNSCYSYLAILLSFISRDESSLAARFARAQRNDAMDAKFGYERYVTPVDRVGWLINIHPVSTVTKYSWQPVDKQLTTYLLVVFLVIVYVSSSCKHWVYRALP